MGAVRVLPGYRVFKDNGDVATDATAAFYLAGTTTPQEVFSDKDLSASLGTSVSASAYGVFPDIFVSDAISVKVIIAATGYTSDTIDYLTVATSGATTFSATISPVSNDGAALGTASLMWSDLFLASGGVINWNAGDVTATHSANLLTFAGASSGYSFDANILLPTSGSVINFNAGDVTITHGANTLTFAGAASGYVFSHALLPSANDGAALGASGTAWADVFIASGGVINFAAGDVTLTHASNALAFAGASSGYSFDATITPASSDGAALGTTALMFSDLFLASGGVVNWNNGDVTVTHSANTLAFAGASSGYTFDAGVQAPVLASTETTGTLTSASANKTIQATGDITVNGSVFAAGDFVFIYSGASSRSIIQGSGMTLRLDGTSTTGTRTLAARGCACLFFVSATECVVAGAAVS